ncbi:hypothetical protein HMPREF9103_02262 [Lentilactobacillus parafarraginis F0439]|uniref:Uncharacterized protein n=1 Tax=Lentilactobacillus parafarraginis F0439 TaxID=797515 RepID=G9ZRA1_9LACO|nr:hypothetical protein HMPREF9103_02262 [Lentilactobacillus parafarraginis F0439]
MRLGFFRASVAIYDQICHTFHEVTVWGKGETAWTFYIVGTITCLTA